MSSELGFFKERKTIIIAAVLIISAIAITSMGALYYFSYYGNVIQFNVFHAGSLTVPLGGSDTFEGMEQAFEKLHPGVDVVCQGAGSRTAVRWITETGKTADIIGSADYTVIENLMVNSTPQWTKWYAIFASNSMVLAYTDNSKYADEINQTNWYSILQRSDVKYGAADPDQDPCGYRTRLVWKLADIYFNTGNEIYQNLTAGSNLIVRPKEVELNALLESGELDFAWNYKSVAVQHDYEYLTLPTKLDLSSPDEKEYYAQANLTLTDSTVKTGQPILYGVSIPNNAPHPDLAVEYVKLLLDTTGQTIFTNAGQIIITPALTNNVTEVPAPIQSYVTQWTDGGTLTE